MGLGHGYRPQMPTSAGQPANPPPAPLTTCAAPGTGALAPLEDEPAQSQALGEACGRGKRGGGLRPDVTALDVAWLIELFGRQGPPPTDAENGNIRRRLLAIALDGLRAGGPSRCPAPGQPPRHYEARWTKAIPRARRG